MCEFSFLYIAISEIFLWMGPFLGSWPSLPFPEGQGVSKSPSSNAGTGLAGMSSPNVSSGMGTSPLGMGEVNSPVGGIAASPMSAASPNSPNQSLASGKDNKNSKLFPNLSRIYTYLMIILRLGLIYFFNICII